MTVATARSNSSRTAKSGATGASEPASTFRLAIRLEKGSASAVIAAINTRSGMRPGGYGRGRARLTEHTDVLGLPLPAVRRNDLVKLDLVADGKPFQPFRE